MTSEYLDKNKILEDAIRELKRNMNGNNYVRIFFNTEKMEVETDTYDNSPSDVIDTTGYVLLTEFQQDPVNLNCISLDWLDTDKGKIWLQARTDEIISTLKQL
mgnify:CR=1 FL=1